MLFLFPVSTKELQAAELPYGNSHLLGCNPHHLLRRNSDGLLWHIAAEGLRNLSNPFIIAESFFNIDRCGTQQLSVRHFLYSLQAARNPLISLLAKGVQIDADPGIAAGIHLRGVVNIIAVQEKNKNNKVYKKVVAAYQTEETKQAIEKTYKGSEVAAWPIFGKN